MADRRLWSAEEDQIILSLIEQHGTAQWTAIAQEMRKFFPNARSSKQIRERWHNQLSPLISRSPWTQHEEASLFAAHSTYGNKWKQIARLLPGRTDNAVKNHFYSTVRRALRRLDKHFGFRDSTRKMRGLKPAALTLLLETSRSHADYTEMMALLLRFAQWKPLRGDKQPAQERSRILYEGIIELISDFNHSYRRGKESALLLEVEEEEGSCRSEEEASNYFGSVGETRSWFTATEQEWSARGCGLGLLCDYEQPQ